MSILANLRVVGGEGPQQPHLIFVGEAPGAEEERELRPFVGSSGQVFDGILRSAGVNRDDCYITNVVKVRPPGNNLGRLRELGLTIEEFYPQLFDELSVLTPRDRFTVLIPLGDTALNALTYVDSISKYRGSPLKPVRELDNGQTWVVPTWHPAYIMRTWGDRGSVVADIQKAIRIAKTGSIVPTYESIIKPTVLEIETFVRALITSGKFAFDLEIASGQILCFGIGGWIDGMIRVMCVPFKHGFNNFYPLDDEIRIWSLLIDLFHSNALKIGQNIVNFDIQKLLPFLGKPSPPWYDTMVAHHTVDPELPHSLAYLTSIYTDIPYYKDDPKDADTTWSNMTSSEVLWEYNIKDVVVPLLVEEQLTREMTQLNVLPFFEGFVTPLCRTLLNVQERGILIDLDERDRLLESATTRLNEMQEVLDKLVGYKMNANSHKQLATLLYDVMKLPIQRNHKTKKPSVDRHALEYLHSRHPSPLFDLVMELRRASKEIGTYLTTELGEDGRLRTNYKATGTKTGRSSSTKTIENEGLDMQNLPPYLRSMFVAPLGRIFKMYDLWQAEAYCVAVFAQVTSFLERFKRGAKIHTLAGSWIFDKPGSELTPDEYHAAKRVTHGSNYGLGKNLLATFLKLPVAQAAMLSARYHMFAPEIHSWHRSVENQLKTTRKMINPFGRTRFFRGRLDEKTFREAYANNPQGTVADYNHCAMNKLEYSLPPGTFIVQEGFDSIIIECDMQQSKEVDRVVAKAYDIEIMWEGTIFKIPVEGKTGFVWEK